MKFTSCWQGKELLAPNGKEAGYCRDDDIQLELMCTDFFYLTRKHNKKCMTQYTVRQKDMTRHEIWFQFFHAIPTQHHIWDLDSCFQLHLPLLELHVKCILCGYYCMSPILVAFVDRTVSGCRSTCECTGIVVKLMRGYPTTVLVSGGGLTTLRCEEIECVWNVMAHAQKPDFVFRRNGRVPLNRRGRQFSRLLAAEVWASAVVMLDTPCSEVVWRVLATNSIRQFPLYFSPVRHRVPSHFNWTQRCYESYPDRRSALFCATASRYWLFVAHRFETM
jgi:hypothetical protein